MDFEQQNHLRVYSDKSEFHSAEGDIEVFSEGVLSLEAMKRGRSIKESFANGYLTKIIEELIEGDTFADIDGLSETAISSVDSLVSSVTSEVGRALIGLTIMQLCIKTIEPNQNIRLHKGGVRANGFSWSEGISMRTLDKQYVTPILRRYDLLRLNADGFMMTRSLAENYPYTPLYKANLKGARQEWLELVDEIENGLTNPNETLKYMVSKLINEASNLTRTANDLIALFDRKSHEYQNFKCAYEVMCKHIEISDYAARLLEISMHALTKTVVEKGRYGLADLKPLSQMRSANKKHGNIGDIEILSDGDIVIAWDAKYGKGYLREEIEEAIEKVENHPNVEIIGFVTTAQVERTDEINSRIADIKELHGISVSIESFEDWAHTLYQETLNAGLSTEEELSKDWLKNYTKYLCQKDRKYAPIDEPCLQWVETLSEILSN